MAHDGSNGNRSGKGKWSPVSKHQNSGWVWRTSGLTRDGTTEPNSRDKTLRRERGQGKFRFPCSADHKQDWQPYPVDAQSIESDDHYTRRDIQKNLSLVANGEV